MTERETSGNVAVITGAGSGVGRATALALAAEGYAVALLGRRRAALDETAELLNQTGSNALVLAADVTSEVAVRAAFADLQATWGRLDTLICAAGTMSTGPVETYPLAEWRATIETNLTGVFLCAREAIPMLRSSGGGAIIAIGSGASRNGYPNLAAYAASKSGLLGLMESVASEVAADGIKVSTIHPGSILTSFGGHDEAERRERAARGERMFIEAEDVANAIVYLLRQPARAWTQEMNLWPAASPH